MISRLSRCRIIASFRSGVDNIDLAAAAERHIPVTRTTGVNFDEVATHTVALLLALVRKIVGLNQAVHEGAWQYSRAAPMHRMSGRVLGVVGFGMIGQAVARKLGGFDLVTLAADPFQAPGAVAERGARLVELVELLRHSDYITLHAPLAPETRHLIGRGELALMKRDALLVNTSRGAVVDELALYEALKEGRLGGAALDTLEEEPPGLLAGAKPGSSAHGLLGLGNVILTPHCAWYSEESAEQTVAQAARRVIAVLTGNEPSALPWDP